MIRPQTNKNLIKIISINVNSLIRISRRLSFKEFLEKENGDLFFVKWNKIKRAA